MIRLRVAGAAGLCLLAAGCAGAPTRPTAKATPAAATRPPHLFDGCALGEAQPAGFEVDCGKVSAIVTAFKAEKTAEAFVDTTLHGLGAHVDAPFRFDRKTVPTPLAGATRQLVRFSVVDTRHPEAPVFRGMMAAWTQRDGRIRLVACRDGKPGKLDRCLGMMDWMAAHPQAPEDLPRAKAPSTGTAPAVADAGPPWPPAGALTPPPGCKAEHHGAAGVSLECGDTEVILWRLTTATDAQAHSLARAAQASMADKALGAMRKMVSPAAARTEVPCHVGDDDGTCDRLAVSAGKDSGQAILGTGRLFGSLVLVECVFPGAGDDVPPACARFLQRRNAGR